MARTCWLLAISLALCLHLGDAGARASPPQDMPQTIDQVIMKTSGGKSVEMFAGRSLGGGMVSDGLDMVLNEKQYQRLYKGIRGRNDGHRTVATPWADAVVPYKIQSGDFSQAQTDWIIKALRNWEKYTCVKFRPATRYDANQILIVAGQGCWAMLGMQGGVQKVNLDPNGCFWKGTIEHEFGHALGLIHEHQRPVRDRYLKINYFAISDGKQDQLTKYAKNSDDKMGLAFDYHSVMHYGVTAFSHNWLDQTIYTRDPTKKDVIGMILVPSYTDIHLINLMYQCEEKNRAKCRSAPRCSAGCFLNHDCKCFCERDMPREVCQDQKSECPQWAASGECHGNPGFMHHYCRKACNICTDDGSVPQMPCVDGNRECQTWANSGQCTINPGYMQKTCRKACGVCTEGEDYSNFGPCRDQKYDCRQRAQDGDCDRNPEVMLEECTQSCDFCPQDVGQEKVPEACEDYDSVCVYRADSGMCQTFYNIMSLSECRRACDTCDTAVTLPADCVDTDARCSQWALRGECSNNPGYMHQGCRMSCQICGPGQGNCEDGNNNCAAWASNGYCRQSNVRDLCKKSCGQC